MRALVIGATGFIGLNLVDALLQQGIEVRATRRRRSPTMFLRKRPVTLADAALEDAESLRRAMDGCDAVFLAGAHYPRYSLDLAATLATGVRGVRNACEAARAVGVGSFVYTSSVAALSRVQGRAACEDDIPDALPAESVYAAVKWAMEREVEEHAARGGLRAVTLLPGGCLGPWDVRLGTGGLLVALVRGELPFWTAGTVALCDVRDVALAHVRALAAAGARYCVAPHAVEFGALVREIVARFGGVVPPEVPAAVARRYASRAERAAAPRRGRVSFPRELVDMILMGQPVSYERTARELRVPVTPLSDSLESAHGFFQRFHYYGPAAPERREEHHDQP